MQGGNFWSCRDALTPRLSAALKGKKQLQQHTDFQPKAALINVFILIMDQMSVSDVKPQRIHHQTPLSLRLYSLLALFFSSLFWFWSQYFADVASLSVLSLFQL